jgi:hypothetical protein
VAKARRPDNPYARRPAMRAAARSRPEAGGGGGGVVGPEWFPPALAGADPGVLAAHGLVNGIGTRP